MSAWQAIVKRYNVLARLSAAGIVKALVTAGCRGPRKLEYLLIEGGNAVEMARPQLPLGDTKKRHLFEDF